MEYINNSALTFSFIILKFSRWIILFCEMSSDSPDLGAIVERQNAAVQHYFFFIVWHFFCGPNIYFLREGMRK